LMEVLTRAAPPPAPAPPPAAAPPAATGTIPGALGRDLVRTRSEIARMMNGGGRAPPSTAYPFPAPADPFPAPANPFAPLPSAQKTPAYPGAAAYPAAPAPAWPPAPPAMPAATSALPAYPAANPQAYNGYPPSSFPPPPPPPPPQPSNGPPAPAAPPPPGYGYAPAPPLPTDPATLRSQAQLVFKRYDSNNSGSIDIYEFTPAMRLLEFQGSDEDIWSLFYIISGNQTQLTEGQFTDYWVANHQTIVPQSPRKVTAGPGQWICRNEPCGQMGGTIQSGSVCQICNARKPGSGGAYENPYARPPAAQEQNWGTAPPQPRRNPGPPVAGPGEWICREDPICGQMGGTVQSGTRCDICQTYRPGAPPRGPRQAVAGVGEWVCRGDPCGQMGGITNQVGQSCTICGARQ